MSDQKPFLNPDTPHPADPLDASPDATEYQEISDEIKRIGDQLDKMIARANRFLES